MRESNKRHNSQLKTKQSLTRTGGAPLLITADHITIPIARAALTSESVHRHNQLGPRNAKRRRLLVLILLDSLLLLDTQLLLLLHVMGTLLQRLDARGWRGRGEGHRLPGDGAQGLEARGRRWRRRPRRRPPIIRRTDEEIENWRHRRLDFVGAYAFVLVAVGDVDAVGLRSFD